MSLLWLTPTFLRDQFFAMKQQHYACGGRKNLFKIEQCIFTTTFMLLHLGVKILCKHNDTAFAYLLIFTLYIKSNSMGGRQKYAGESIYYVTYMVNTNSARLNFTEESTYDNCCQLPTRIMVFLVFCRHISSRHDRGNSPF